MLYITETSKDFETAAKDLEEAVKRHKYGVLHIPRSSKDIERERYRFSSPSSHLRGL